MCSIVFKFLNKPERKNPEHSKYNNIVTFMLNFVHGPLQINNKNKQPAVCCKSASMKHDTDLWPVDILYSQL